MLNGRIEFLRRQKSSEGSLYLLRRNIHRVEKGLVMRPRRDVFAADYILDTVKAFTGLKRNASDVYIEEIAWAEHVLCEYFAAVGHHPDVIEAREMFSSLRSGPLACREKIPFVRDLSTPPPISYDALYALAKRRRSVRWFDNRRVGRELIDKALIIAREAPSACNRQPYRFIIFDDPERAHEIGAIPLGTAGFSENFPAVAVVVGDLSAYFRERDRHAIYTDGSLAIMSFILALETLGLASCCINWPDIESSERRMDKALGLKPYERPIMVVAFGYPDPTGKVPFSQKAPLAEVRTYK